MKVAVTGANGFIGHYLCRELIARGHAVRAFVRRRAACRGLDGIGCEVVVGDLADWDSVAGLLAGCDAVFHNGYWQGHASGADPSATPIDFVRYVEINLVGLYRMLSYCRDSGIERFFLTSSGAALGPVDESEYLTLDESHACCPRTEYGAFKRASELYVATFRHQYGLRRCAALRPMGSAIFGVPRDRTRAALYAEWTLLRKNEPVCADLAGPFSTCHARDLARVALAIAQAPDAVDTQALYHVPGDVGTLGEVLRTMREAVGSSSPLVNRPGRAGKPIGSAAAVRRLGVEFRGMAGVREHCSELMDTESIRLSRTR